MKTLGLYFWLLISLITTTQAWIERREQNFAPVNDDNPSNLNLTSKYHLFLNDSALHNAHSEGNSSVLPQIDIATENISPKKDTSNLKYHIIPFSHTDPGWIVPFDAYYKGEMTPNRECVRCILDTAFSLLSSNKSRVFSFTEISYFERWFEEQSAAIKSQFNQLVQSNQFFFPGAGWVMNDEASAYYEDVIEQFILGHVYLNQRFNYVPTTGWSIDPFGHSATQAYLFAQMGINMVFLERIHSKDLEKRKKNGDMEFIWMPYEQFPEWNIVGHLNFLKYGPTNEALYCFPGKVCEYFSEESNSLPFSIHWLNKQSEAYATNQIAWHIGNDFTFSINGSELYQYLESYVQKVNSDLENAHGTAILSTPEMYSNDWYQDYIEGKRTELKMKFDDFFPYATSGDRTIYWTGFYSSRPGLKRLIFESSWLLQSARKVAVSTFLSLSGDIGQLGSFLAAFREASKDLERALALSQHHDAITGTSPMRTIHDYLMRLESANEKVWKMIFQAFEMDVRNYLNSPLSDNLYSFHPSILLPGSQDSSDQLSFTCSVLKSSINCDGLVNSAATNNSLLLRVYNPGPNKNTLFRVKIPHHNYQGNDFSFLISNSTAKSQVLLESLLSTTLSARMMNTRIQWGKTAICIYMISCLPMRVDSICSTHLHRKIPLKRLL